MIVSLFIFLVVYFRSINLHAPAILLIIRYWASCSDRPLIMGAVQDELNIVVFVLLHLSHFEFLLQNLQYVSSYMLLVIILFVSFGCFH
jgi:hypothetical protein